MNRLGGFLSYLNRVFDLSALALSLRDQRPYPQIPLNPIWWSLFLGEVLRVPSFLQLEAETARGCWQKRIGTKCKMSDDLFGYVSERFELEDLRRHLVQTNKTLKRNKALEGSKIQGLLIASIDANEQFNSRSRCCEACLQRQIKLKDSQGEEYEVTEYFHKQVYCQINGARLNVILDLESQRPGEEEAATALRLLERIRQNYGPRFFDIVAADAWYATGPFMKRITEWGWGLVVVFKQQRYDIWKESEALLAGKPPLTTFEEGRREVELWEVTELPFTDSYDGLIRLVRSQEQLSKRRQLGGEFQNITVDQQWRWLVNEHLDGYEAKVIWQIGHCRWKIENNAFNELTQAWNLEHCPHHHPVAIMALLLIKVLAFNLFKAFVHLQSKLWRMGKVTLQEIRLQFYRGLEQLEPALLDSS